MARTCCTSQKWRHLGRAVCCGNGLAPQGVRKDHGGTNIGDQEQRPCCTGIIEGARVSDKELTSPGVTYSNAALASKPAKTLNRDRPRVQRRSSANMKPLGSDTTKRGAHS